MWFFFSFFYNSVHFWLNSCNWLVGRGKFCQGIIGTYHLGFPKTYIYKEKDLCIGAPTTRLPLLKCNILFFYSFRPSYHEIISITIFIWVFIRFFYAIIIILALILAWLLLTYRPLKAILRIINFYYLALRGEDGFSSSV